MQKSDNWKKFYLYICICTLLQEIKSRVLKTHYWRKSLRYFHTYTCNSVQLVWQVHAIYQKCRPNLLASCNCGVAVQSGDDVIVIDRCLRRQLRVPDFRSRWSSESGPAMVIQLFLNGDLTQGTKIHKDADGKKYLVSCHANTVLSLWFIWHILSDMGETILYLIHWLLLELPWTLTNGNSSMTGIKISDIRL